MGHEDGRGQDKGVEKRDSGCRLSVPFDLMFDGTIDGHGEQKAADLGQCSTSTESEGKSASQVDEFPHDSRTALCVGGHIVSVIVMHASFSLTS